MLRAMSGKRGEIARCMAFALEHAEAAHEIAELIVASLLVEGTPVPRKVARLHLIVFVIGLELRFIVGFYSVAFVTAVSGGNGVVVVVAG